MLRHQGKSRTLKHNLRIATVLSFVAGIVNVAGFLAFKQLTTNVTGHFAFFIGDVADFEIWKGTIFFLYIFSFFFGSFLSSFLIENYRESKKLNVFVLPTLIEVLVLLAVGIASNFMVFGYPKFFFIGGLLGRFLYSTVNWKLNTVVFAAVILLVSLFFDDLRYQIILARRKFNQRNWAKEGFKDN